jgi:phosphoesterase RecJ-like protein
LIEKSKKILLINHIKMDPDAFWSLTTFYIILEKLGKKVKATNDFLPPENFAFLWFNHIFEKDLDIRKFDPDLIISFDTGGISRLWETYEKYKDVFDNKTLVNIDHHITNPWFWDLNIIEDNSSSTCEIIFYILEEMWLQSYIQSKEASLLMAWILTDTNTFYNTNTTSRTLFTSAKLFELWADLRWNIYNFFCSRNYNKLKLKSIVLKNMQKSEDSKIVWSKLSKKDFKKNWVDEIDTGCLKETISEMINIEWSEVAFLLYPFQNQTKASFRSKNFDIWNFCASFWWWWHKLAAGFTIKKSRKELEKEILWKLKEYKI